MEFVNKHFKYRLPLGLIYQKGNIFAHGGYGRISLGYRISDKKKVVIKTIEKNAISDWVNVGGLFVPREIISLGKCSNIPGVVKIVDSFQSGTDVHIVFEYRKGFVDGIKYLDKKGCALKERDALMIFKKLTVAVGGCVVIGGLFHRDIKLENMLIRQRRNKFDVLLIDFGLAANLKTVFTQFVGTPSYSPPEFYLLHPYDGNALTAWQLGVVLFALLRGFIIFEGLPKPKHQLDIDVQLDFELEDDPLITLETEDLIRGLLKYDPTKRSSIFDILVHPALNDIP